MGEMDEETWKNRLAGIRRFERQLTDNGYLVLKFFLHISRDEQKRRMEELEQDIDTKWRINKADRWQNKHYKTCLDIFDQYLGATDLPSAPWYVVDAGAKKWAELQVLEMLTEGIDTAMQNQALAVPVPQNVFPLLKMPKLSEIPLEGKNVSDEAYKEELKSLQSHLGELHNLLYRKRIPVIIAYEGWDAAGKGGNIRRITEALDP